MRHMSHNIVFNDSGDKKNNSITSGTSIISIAAPTTAARRHTMQIIKKRKEKPAANE